MSIEALGSFAGPTGVGALFFLGVFLILDGRAPTLFPAFETYAKTSAWAVVAAVPFLAIAYLVGLVLITGASAAVRSAYGPGIRQEAVDTLLVSSTPAKESVLAQRYSELQKDKDILAGAVFSLIVLALGALSERRTLKAENGLDGWLVVTGALIALVGAAALFVAAGARAHEAHIFAQTCTAAVDTTAATQAGSQPKSAAAVQNVVTPPGTP